MRLAMRFLLIKRTDGLKAHQAPPCMGFSRQEYWSRLPFPSPEDLPHPGIEPESTRIVGRCFTVWATREAFSFSAAVAAAKSLQSCPTLCDPIDGSPPGSPVPRILQARTLEWVAISFSLSFSTYTQKKRSCEHRVKWWLSISQEDSE